MAILLLLLQLFTLVIGHRYKVEVLSKRPTPAISLINPKGKGYSPCRYTFNPAFLPPSPQLNHSILLVRAAECPKDFGGSLDHIMLARCSSDGNCDDLQNVTLKLERRAEDPRVVYYDGYYYLFYYASGVGERTVYIRRSNTPLDPDSWQRLSAPLPWHRNGCVLLREKPPHYVIYGESPPLKALGLATTTDFQSFKTVNGSFLRPNGAKDKKEPEIVVEASTPLVKLSTGDYLHIYSAGTPGWVPHGNYTGGWIVLDGKDPTKIVQRSAEHVLVPTMDYEIGDGPYPVQRHRTIFATSLLPTGTKDEFRVWYGAADANVATALLKVTVER
eukprot:TRINITY_DN66882_c4_g11_i1.p1 TRINITY_DN66882_c4_g11~~TRINITY_DN66882_c4_g11_i1.p1  ORF type:complete len:339 (+),score=17.60 TRINITY_DN66882_c4_g11_i1:25-1017(+)